MDDDASPARRFCAYAIGIGRTIRHLGWMNGCLYALARVAGIVFGDKVRIHKYYFVAQPVPEGRWLPPHRGRGFEIRQVAEFDTIVGQFPRPARAAPYRFGQGAVCLAALKAEKLIGFLWFTLGPYQEDEVRCRYLPLPPGKAAWDFDVHVDPEHRNGIVFLRLWDEANCLLRSQRIQWSLSRISAFNTGSILSHAKMGAKRIGAATFLSMGSWQIAGSTVSPYLHLSTHTGSLPTYALNPEQSPKTTIGR